jgi:hypothetical protein
MGLRETLEIFGGRRVYMYDIVRIVVRQLAATSSISNYGSEHNSTLPYSASLFNLHRE